MPILKKLLIWSGGTVVLLLLLGVAALVITGRRDQQERKERQKSVRERTKVHVGDDPLTVRVRLGVPAETYGDKGDSVWTYLDNTGGELLGNVIFIGGHVEAIRLATRNWWIAEDGLFAAPYSDLNRTLDDFEEVLGVPCDTSITETSLVYSYRLSSQELAEDSIYRRWNRGDSSKVTRTLEVDLRKGKKVVSHGWEIDHKSSCLQ